MADEQKLTKDEERLIGELTDKLIAINAKCESKRTELFKTLSVFVEGVKLGLINQPSVTA